MWDLCDQSHNLARTCLGVSLTVQTGASFRVAVLIRAAQSGQSSPPPPPGEALCGWPSQAACLASPCWPHALPLSPSAAATGNPPRDAGLGGGALPPLPSPSLPTPFLGTSWAARGAHGGLLRAPGAPRTVPRFSPPPARLAARGAVGDGARTAPPPPASQRGAAGRQPREAPSRSSATSGRPSPRRKAGGGLVGERSIGPPPPSVRPPRPRRDLRAGQRLDAPPAGAREPPPPAGRRCKLPRGPPGRALPAAPSRARSGRRRRLPIARPAPLHARRRRQEAPLRARARGRQAEQPSSGSRPSAAPANPRRRRSSNRPRPEHVQSARSLPGTAGSRRAASRLTPARGLHSRCPNAASARGRP